MTTFRAGDRVEIHAYGSVRLSRPASGTVTRINDSRYILVDIDEAPARHGWLNGQVACLGVELRLITPSLRQLWRTP